MGKLDWAKQKFRERAAEQGSTDWNAETMADRWLTKQKYKINANLKATKKQRRKAKKRRADIPPN